ncbi:MAG: UDP-N-acetylglucosamine--LPS N-acetylglucosamine transferase [Planctomycetota bacterium]
MTDTNRRATDPASRRILAVASGGGHWVQLLRLRPSLAGEHVAWVTVHRSCRDEVGPAPFYVVTDATRWNRLGLIRLAIQLLIILWRERPDVVISTGAAPGYLALRLARLFGARTIWIDSVANAERMSLSGQRVERFADLWLTQWPELARESGPRYAGAVL